MNYLQAESSRKNEKRTINSYFLPAKKQVLENDTFSSQLTHDKSRPKTSPFLSQISSCPSSTQTPLVLTQIPQTFYSTDIGQYIGKIVDDYTKCQLLENPWVPPKDCLFPYSEHI